MSCRPRGGAGQGSLLLRLGGEEAGGSDPGPPARRPHGRRGMSPRTAGSSPPPEYAQPRDLHAPWLETGLVEGGGGGPVCPAAVPSQALKEEGTTVRCECLDFI